MSLMKTHNQWIALKVRSKQEKQIHNHLSANGYESFLPTLPICGQCRRGCNGGVLFPGYLFCRFDASNPCRIVTIPGVLGPIAFGDSIPVLKPAEIESIRIIAASSRCWRNVKTLYEGESVAVVSGPLAGVRGQFVRTTSKKGLVVSVAILNRAVLVQLSDTDVVSCSSSGNQEC
jgi:transcriptional antiterminator RfaH